MEIESARRRFNEALEELVGQVKAHRSILEALLCGSLSHGTVFARSDIDLTLITTDDKKPDPSDVALNTDGVNAHALLFPCAEFRRLVEGSARSSFMRSFLAKGGLHYAHDPTIVEL